MNTTTKTVTYYDYFIGLQNRINMLFYLKVELLKSTEKWFCVRTSTRIRTSFVNPRDSRSQISHGGLETLIYGRYTA